MIRAIALCGPTASGKTALSVRIAKRLGCEIISCDSMQLYRGMDIGTAKVTKEEMLGVPHHMIDILDPREDFSVSDYRETALRIAGEIVSRGKIPFFVGGTGLYIDSLLRAPLSRVPESDPALLERYREISEHEGGKEELHAKLAAIDPESAAAIHPNNVRRVIRALILYEMTGETKTEIDRKSRTAPADISVGMATLLFHRRETLYERTDRRVDEMLAAGLEDEVRALFSSGALRENTTAAQAIGYKEFSGYLRGECDRAQAADAVRLATRHYAKRQLTWFRTEADAMPVYTDEEDGTSKSPDVLVEELISCYNSYFANNNQHIHICLRKDFPMKANELKQLLANGALNAYTALYADPAAQAKRMTAAIDQFVSLYGADRDISLFSVPGRSEISGNHTDHNHGCVLAGAIDRDIIAVAAKNEDGVIRFHSEGYTEDTVDLSDIDDPAKYKNYSSASLIAGLAKGFTNRGFAIGGYDAYSTTQVLKGSGISSSAAYEVMIGNVLNYFYNDGKISNVEIAKLSQFAENVYFGKPCGLMDQTACAVGGFVYIDFENPTEPVIEPIDFSLTAAGYALCIVNTGGNHANLNEDYASVPAEMKAVAAAFGKEVLRGLTEDELFEKIPALRETVGDRAILRAIHFLRENGRVEKIRTALKAKDTDTFLSLVRASGDSSFKYLQNVYTNQNPSEQGLSLALALTEGFLAGRDGACRVHGGGFAGTIQVFLKAEDADAYCEKMDKIFGHGAAMKFRIRPLGATKLF